jgi:CRISPR-associated protein Cas2
MSQQVILVVYDIREDDLRLKVARYLKKLGFSRIQKSVFVSSYTPALLAETEAGLRRIFKDKTMYNLQIYVFSKASFDKRVVMSEGYIISEEDEFLV